MTIKEDFINGCIGWNAPQLLKGLKWALSELNIEPHEWTSEENAKSHQEALKAIAQAEGKYGI